MKVLMRGLNDENFLVYAIQAYDNPHCTGPAEFLEDIQRIKYVKRLLNRYEERGDLKERLILNHMMVLHNMFGDHMPPMLFHRLKRKHWPQLKTFMLYMNILVLDCKVDESTHMVDIPLDMRVADALRAV